MLVAFGAVPAVPRVRGHADRCLLCPDGGLYTATRYEFRSLPDIRRNLHQRPLKTEESPLHWLNGGTSLSPSQDQYHGPWDAVDHLRESGGWPWGPLWFAMRGNRVREGIPHPMAGP